MATGHNCGDCRYWLKDTNVAVEGGVCRRFPPSVIVVESTLAVVAPAKSMVVTAGAQQPLPMQVLSAGNLQAHFPMMAADGWCGEHKAKVGDLN